MKEERAKKRKRKLRSQRAAATKKTRYPRKSCDDQVEEDDGEGWLKAQSGRVLQNRPSTNEVELKRFRDSEAAMRIREFELEQRTATLETWVAAMETRVAAMETRAAALENREAERNDCQHAVQIGLNSPCISETSATEHLNDKGEGTYDSDTSGEGSSAPAAKKRKLNRTSDSIPKECTGTFPRIDQRTSDGDSVDTSNNLGPCSSPGTRIAVKAKELEGFQAIEDDVLPPKDADLSEQTYLQTTVQVKSAEVSLLCGPTINGTADDGDYFWAQFIDPHFDMLLA